MGEDSRESVKAKVTQIQPKRIMGTIESLAKFRTRSTFSRDEKNGGPAARRYLAEGLMKLASATGGTFHTQEFDGETRYGPAHMQNFWLEFAGKDPKRKILVTAHYDTINLQSRTSKNWELETRGANDDASGCAVLVEVAHLLKDWPREATVILLWADAEEHGLVGSTHFAEEARMRGETFEAVLAVDSVGTATDASGRKDTSGVRLFSAPPDESPSRQLARYVFDAAKQVTPKFKVNLVFRRDRIGRDSDATPFVTRGAAGVRFCEQLENYNTQHNEKDVPANCNPAYIAKVTKVVAAAVLQLAQAPPKPKNLKLRRWAEKGRWQISWEADPGAVRYELLIRKTTEPVWTERRDLGKALEYELGDRNADDLYLGLCAVGTNGTASLPATFHLDAETIRP